MMFNKLLTTKNIPTQWKTSTIILLHKKRKRDDLNNYRTICLISNLYKAFMKVITNRLPTTMDENQPPEQAGYSMTDHLQAVKQIIEKCQEFNINLYTTFINNKKALDSIEHFKVLEALRIMGITQSTLE